jgi:hypothetical protein
LAEDVFEMKTRLHANDRHPSNAPAHAQLMSKRSSDWTSLGCECEAHMNFKVHRSATSYLDWALSGMCHIALAMGTAGDLVEFQQCIKDVVRPMIRFRVGVASPEDLIYKHACIRSFFSGKSNAIQRRIMLTLLPDGNWTDPEWIDIWLSSLDEHDLGELLENICDAIAQALAPSTPETVNRQKWSGVQTPICQIGMLLLFHLILVPVFELFAGRNEKNKVATGDADSAPSLDSGGGHHAIVLVGGADDMRLMPAQDGPAASGVLSVSDFHVAKMGHVKGAAAFLARDKPSAHTATILLRNVCSPLQELLGDQAALSSEKWDNQQRAKAARAVAHGTPHGQRLTRDFRILIAAEGILENKCMNKFLILPSALTNRTRAYAFIMLNRSGALLEKLIARRHRLPPYNNFLLLAQPELADDLQAQRHCMKDPWTKALHDKYPDLSSPEVFAVLLLHALLAYMNIVPQENFNAYIRRLIKSRPQTQQIDTEQLGASIVASRFRKMRDAAGREFQSEFLTRATDDADMSVPAEKKKTTHSGGAWKAYMRKCKSNQTHDVAQAYNAIKAADGDEMRQLELEGSEATERAHRGELAFGLKTRKVLELNSARVAATHLARLQLQDRADTAQVFWEEVISNIDCPTTAIKTARMLERQESKRRSDAVKADRSALEAHASTETTSQIGQLCTALPAFARMGGVLRAESVLAGVRVLRVGPEFSAERATLVYQKLCDDGKESNLGFGIDKFWAYLHRMIRDTPDTEAATDRLPESPSLCWLAGQCICSVAGRQLYQVRNRFLRLLKEEFPKSDSVSHNLLVSSQVVIRMTSVPDVEDEDEQLDLAELWGLEARWNHVSDICLSPYEPTLAMLYVVDGDELALANASGNELALKADQSMLRIQGFLEITWVTFLTYNFKVFSMKICLVVS